MYTYILSRDVSRMLSLYLKASARSWQVCRRFFFGMPITAFSNMVQPLI